MSVFDRAVVLWISKRDGVDAERITSVEFEGGGGSCDTCDFGAFFGLQYYLDDKSREEIDLRNVITPGQFVSEIAEIAVGLED